MMEQPGEYDSVNPIWQRGRDYGIKEERERNIKALTNFAAACADAGAERTAKLIILAVDVIEGQV